MWQVLKETYQMDNPQSFANLKSALEHCKMHKGQSLEEYIKSHEQLVYQHAAVGKPISDMERVVSFLGGLPDRFDTLKTMYMSTAGLSYKNMVIGLRSFEASKLKPLERSDKGGKGAQAFAAKGPKPKSKKPFKKKDPCIKCGFSSHRTEDCKVDLTTLTCLKCEKKGHSIYLCKAKLVSPGENASVAVVVEKDIIVESSMMAELVEITAPATNLLSSTEQDDEAHYSKGRSETTDPIIVDSGATSHMFNDARLFVSKSETEGVKKVALGDSHTIDIAFQGDVKLQLPTGTGKITNARLKGVLYTPSMSKNLFSVTSCTREGNSVHFYPSGNCLIQGPNQQVLATARLKKNLWVLDIQKSKRAVYIEENDPGNSSGYVFAADEMESARLWHLRLGHIGEDRLLKMINNGMVDGLSMKKDGPIKAHCTGC